MPVGARAKIHSLVFDHSEKKAGQNDFFVYKYKLWLPSKCKLKKIILLTF